MKVKKIVILIVSILCVLRNNVYAKYVYSFNETIIELTRDSNSPVCNISYSNQEITNENVEIMITCDKEVQQVSGFELSENKKILTKEVYENESGKVTVRDLSGNCTDVEYEVNNIDKEVPQIIGCENGGTYPSPLKLEYSDNGEIQDVVVDKYNDNLIASIHEFYYDSYVYHGIGRTNTTLTVNVDTHPRNTKKYRYYIQNELYTTTTEKNYTFTGLNRGSDYEIKIEAIDELGNILDEVKINTKTSYYNSITSTKTDKKFLGKFNDLDNSVSKIKYAVWNCQNENDIKWYEALINNNEANIECIKLENEFYPAYNIHAYMYDENNNILDVVAFSIDFGTKYENNSAEINVNELIEPGNYQITVNDFANNEIVYNIKVE